MITEGLKVLALSFCILDCKIKLHISTISGMVVQFWVQNCRPTLCGVCMFCTPHVCMVSPGSSSFPLTTQRLFAHRCECECACSFRWDWLQFLHDPDWYRME